MKLWHMIAFVVIGLLFLYPRSEKTVSMERQEQQAEEVMDESVERLSYKVVYHSESESQDKLADIQWLKKAAATAIEHGNPYFNIVEQRLIRSAKPRSNMGRVTVEGVIQLSPDPMQAEYDAREIRSLVLSEQ